MQSSSPPDRERDSARSWLAGLLVAAAFVALAAGALGLLSGWMA